MRTLVAGWFSFSGMNVTAGDTLARDLACDWLREAGVDFDVANAPTCGEGLDWRAARPGDYAQVVFVCGPFRDNPITAEFLAHFRGLRVVGLDLSMLQPLAQWNPFDVLFERDSDRTQRPDLVFAADQPAVPVVGLLLVHPQPQYGKRAMHDAAGKAIRRLINSRPMAVVPIDTCLEDNKGGLRNPAEVESLIARMDVVLTTRLHGMVMALKNGVPALALDPIAGGAKIVQQARAVQWPVVLTADKATDEDLARAFDYCLTPEARAAANHSRRKAQEELDVLRRQFVEAVAFPGMVEAGGGGRGVAR